MPDPTDDPFRKVQEELKDLDASAFKEESDYASRIQKLMQEAGEEIDPEAEAALVASMQAKVSQSATPSPVGEDFEASLRRLEEKAGIVRGKQAADEAALEKERAAMRKDTRGMGIGLTIAYTIVGVPMVGALIGWLIDMRLGTNLGKGLGTLTGAVIGIGVALAMMNRPENKP